MDPKIIHYTTHQHKYKRHYDNTVLLDHYSHKDSQKVFVKEGNSKYLVYSSWHKSTQINVFGLRIN